MAFILGGVPLHTLRDSESLDVASSHDLLLACIYCVYIYIVYDVGLPIGQESKSGRMDSPDNIQLSLHHFSLALPCTELQLRLNSATMTRDLEQEAAVDVEGDFSNSSSDFPLYGYHHWATTTMYGDAPRAACGGIDTHRLVAGTRYHNVASAQSMWRNWAYAKRSLSV